MPKSKRDKKISLTTTKKHGKDWKKKMIENVQKSAEKYKGIYALKLVGLRSAGLRNLRKAWRDSGEIVLGKNKLLALALGSKEESEIHPNLHKLASRLTGNCGLLFTNKDEEEVVQYFNEFSEKDYARAGQKATETLILDEGPLKEFAHSIEPHLRSLGMPTSLQKGIITLTKNFQVCKKGEPLTSNQAAILKLLGILMSSFKIKIDSLWNAPDIFKAKVIEPEEDIVGSGDEEEGGGGSEVEMEEDEEEIDE